MLQETKLGVYVCGVGWYLYFEFRFLSIRCGRLVGGVNGPINCNGYSDLVFHTVSPEQQCCKRPNLEFMFVGSIFRVSFLIDKVWLLGGWGDWAY